MQCKTICTTIHADKPLSCFGRRFKFPGRLERRGPRWVSHPKCTKHTLANTFPVRCNLKLQCHEGPAKERYISVLSDITDCVQSWVVDYETVIYPRCLSATACLLAQSSKASIPTDTGVPPEDVPVEDVEGQMSKAAWDLTVEVLAVERAAERAQRKLGLTWTAGGQEKQNGKKRDEIRQVNQNKGSLICCWFPVIFF